VIEPPVTWSQVLEEEYRALYGIGTRRRRREWQARRPRRHRL